MRTLNKMPLCMLSCRDWQASMCDECEQLDKKVAHYRQLAPKVLDTGLIAVLEKLIAKAEAEKAALHPASDPGNESSPKPTNVRTTKAS